MARKVLRSGRRMKARFAYVGIRVKNIEESLKFYSRVLGMRVSGRGTYEPVGGTFVSLVSQDGGFELELNHYRKGSRFAKPYHVGEGIDHLAFDVPDLDKALAEYAKLGYAVVDDFTRAETGGRWVILRDPNGIDIKLSL
jgi:catechol 2,3-dioxygenase-like lactoylglutathione lyase family enzyme